MTWRGNRYGDMSPYWRLDPHLEKQKEVITAMNDRDTPLCIVRKWKRILPGIYNVLDDLKAANGFDDLHWPSFCDLPIGAAFTFLASMLGLSQYEAARVSAELTACYTWRKNKVIYSFDEDLARVLVDQANDLEDTNVLPAEALMHPPYPCTFIRTNVFDGMSGFWYWVEYDVNSYTVELRVQLVTESMERSIPLVLHLLPGKTIRECYDDTMAETIKYLPPHRIKDFQNHAPQDLRYVLAAVQFILYIVSENADIKSIPSNGVRRARKKSKRTLDKANGVKEKSVGIRIGNAIRKNKLYNHPSSLNKTGFTKRPHSRRGHWHHYWVGPRDGDRTLVLKWVAPTFIHRDAFQSETAVIFPVKQ